MNEADFLRFGTAISREAGVLDSLHGYFTMHAPRLHRCCELFGLFNGQLGDILEVGPFYGYTPFALRPRASSYHVLEGDDPAVQPLLKLYESQDIQAQLLDLFGVFGGSTDSTHRLPFNDETFDRILCWETMEHFNFNPVKYVREMLRVLKPGGEVCITVPNRASLQSLVGLMSGRHEREDVGRYFQFEHYVSGGRNVFYGFHWREYTRSELQLLFQQAGFEIIECNTFVTFQNPGRVGAMRRVARLGSTVVAGALTRFGTNVFLRAVKPA